MQKGDVVLITYKLMDNKTVIATFYEYENGKYLFKDKSGFFAVSEQKLVAGGVTMEAID